MEDEKLKELIVRLTVRLGREPTEQEVWKFIYGDTQDRIKVWNRGVYRDYREPDIPML